MKHGPSEEKVRKQAEQNKTPLPQWLIDKPSIPLGLGTYYRAYSDLHTCRPVGMAEGRIPWIAANEWARRNGLSDHDFDDLWRIATALDVAYLDYRAANTKPPNERIGSGGARQPRRGR